MRDYALYIQFRQYTLKKTLFKFPYKINGVLKKKILDVKFLFWSHLLAGQMFEKDSSFNLRVALRRYLP